MTSTRRVTLVLVTLAGPLVAAGLLAGPAHARPVPLVRDTDSTGNSTPLTVQLTSISPGVIPKKGKVTLTGTVTNDSDETWQAINAAPFVGSAPITSHDALAEAARTPPTTTVGDRFTATSLIAPLGDLEPGQSAPFTIRLPRGVLPRETGVYWIGVHALGTNAQGRDDVADGRARTFIALLPPKATATTAIVVPIRTAVRRDDAGRVLDPESFLGQIGPGGPLSREIAFGSAAGRVGEQVTWLVDPAVLDAARDLAAGNPAFALGEASGSGGTPSPGASPAPTKDDDSPPDPHPLTDAQRAVARSWLSGAESALRGNAVLGLPYADADASAVRRARPGLLARAVRLSQDSFATHQITATPAIAPPGGWLDQDTFNATAPGTVALLSDHGRAGRRTLWGSPGATLVLGAADASSGGPGPTPPLDPLALRQRILADAALRAIDGAHDPMVVTLPTDWDPGPHWQQAGFFDGLAQPWLSTAGIANPPTDLPAYPRTLPYPRTARRAEIPRGNVVAAAQLTRTGIVFGHLLGTRNTVADTLTRAGLAAASYDARGDQQVAQAQTQSIESALRSRMSGVVVNGTDFVTLSSLQGILIVSVANNLSEPVTVGLRVHALDGKVSFAPVHAMTIGGGERTTVRLHADASSIGVHQIELDPVTSAGERLGTPLRMTLRTSQVGRLIWIILVVAGGVLVIAILRRIYLRIRSHQWRQA